MNPKHTSAFFLLLTGVIAGFNTIFFTSSIAHYKLLVLIAIIGFLAIGFKPDIIYKVLLFLLSFTTVIVIYYAFANPFYQFTCIPITALSLMFSIIFTDKLFRKITQ